MIIHLALDVGTAYAVYFEASTYISADAGIA
jgi:hypothetical protein